MGLYTATIYMESLLGGREGGDRAEMKRRIPEGLNLSLPPVCDVAPVVCLSSSTKQQPQAFLNRLSLFSNTMAVSLDVYDANVTQQLSASVSILQSPVYKLCYSACLLSILLLCRLIVFKPSLLHRWQERHSSFCACVSCHSLLLTLLLLLLLLFRVLHYHNHRSSPFLPPHS